VALVARAHWVTANQVFEWRRAHIRSCFFSPFHPEPAQTGTGLLQTIWRRETDSNPPAIGCKLGRITMPFDRCYLSERNWALLGHGEAHTCSTTPSARGFIR
jgi:hypothetical protein